MKFEGMGLESSLCLIRKWCLCGIFFLWKYRWWSHNPIRITQCISVLTMNLLCDRLGPHISKTSSRLGSFNLEIISKPTFPMKLQPVQWKSGDVSQMGKHWHSGGQKCPSNPQLDFRQYLCVELRSHERVKDKSTVYYIILPRKISRSWPNLWMNPKFPLERYGHL